LEIDDILINGGNFMNIETLKQEIEKMLIKAKEEANVLGMHDLDYYPFKDGKVYALEEVLELFNKEE